MIVRNLSRQSTEYTSNVYYATGDYHQLSDLNTLVDVGRDGLVLHELGTIRPGIGKRVLDQIFLTHSHFDHSSLLTDILPRFTVPVYAHPRSRIQGIIPVSNGQTVMIGDRRCEVIYAGTHSEDSICYFCHDDGVLFSGDVPMRIYTTDSAYEPAFLTAFETICSLPVREILPGHGDPIQGNANHILNESYKNLRKSAFA